MTTLYVSAPDQPLPNLTLGVGSYLGPFCISYGGRITVGNYTSIAGNVTFLTGPSVRHACEVNPKSVTNYNFGREYPADGITIGSDVLIGTGAIIFGGVTVGHGAIVGAGSVVTKDVDPFIIVAGNPAKVINCRFDDMPTSGYIDEFTLTSKKAKAMCCIAWWNWKPEDIEKVLPLMDDIDAFLREYGS